MSMMRAKLRCKFVVGDKDGCYQLHLISFLSLDYSQPSISSYFDSIVEREDRIVKELDASAKRRLDCVGGLRAK